MRTGSDHLFLNAEVHAGLQAFDRLREEWSAAVDRAHAPSLFVTPVFTELSWQHFARPGDEPWIVTVRDAAGMLVGLLPLALCVEMRHHFPLKVLRHIGAWSGDRPGVLHLVDAWQVWQAALSALLRRQPDWHQLDLREIDVQELPAAAMLQAVGHLSVQARPDTYSGVLPITGTWDDYFRSRSKNTRQAYRRSERLLQEACPEGLHIEVNDAVDSVAEAFERYIAIERLGWKSGAKVGLWADPREADFHRSLLPRLAQTGQASVWMLRSGARDIAGLVRLRQGSTTYERYSTYDPEFARCSPGTWLCMEAVRRLFGTDCTRSDALGLHEPLANRPAIGAWYDIEQRTCRLVATREIHGLRLYRQSRQAFDALRAMPASRWQRVGVGVGAAAVATALTVMN
jgi:CelD/BcsL family acetyltransferase involved in cellulose biosynthesis